MGVSVIILDAIFLPRLAAALRNPALGKGCTRSGVIEKEACWSTDVCDDGVCLSKAASEAEGSWFMGEIDAEGCSSISAVDAAGCFLG